MCDDSRGLFFAQRPGKAWGRGEKSKKVCEVFLLCTLRLGRCAGNSIVGAVVAAQIGTQAAGGQPADQRCGSAANLVARIVYREGAHRQGHRERKRRDSDGIGPRRDRP